MQVLKHIAAVADALGLTRLFFAGRFYYGKHHIRAVAYHATPRQYERELERHCRFFARHYTPVTLDDLELFFQTGRWHKPKPGLILSFDDGWRDQYEVAAPILERFGFTGWFFISVGPASLPVTEQRKTSALKEGKEFSTYDDGRCFMTWDEIALLRDRHEIGCHTWSHYRMRDGDTSEVLMKEIKVAKKFMEDRLKAGIQTFSWVGGAVNSYTAAAEATICEAGYRYAFMTNHYPILPGQRPLRLQRTHLEAWYPLSLVIWRLSVLMDLFYRRKRKQVEKKLSGSAV